jgi:hypothetical protein
MTEKTETAQPAVWVDGDPLMEAIAAAVWEQCGRSDSGMCVEDDPRNIAATAAVVVRPPATDRTALLSDAERTMLAYALDQAQEHIWSRDGFTDEDQAAVDSLRRLAAVPAAVSGRTDDETQDDLPARLEAALTERYTELGNPFSEMRRREQGPDGWPASHPVGPRGVAEVLRELLAAPAVGGAQPKEA